jgi:DNA-binding GntR family transcriptional regulator
MRASAIASVPRLQPITYRAAVPQQPMTAVLFQTKADHAYHYVRQQIARGVLPAGEPINQEELAAGMGISVTPLREAIRRLAAEGFVVLAAHRDARVAPLSAEEARSLSEMRIPLESLAAGLAAERIDPAQREALDALAGQLEPLGEHASEHALDVHRRFHATIWDAAHNEPLTATLDLLWDRADRYRRHGLSEIRGTGATRTADFEQHFELRDLIAAGDRDRAADLMRRHVEFSLLSLGPAAVARAEDPVGPA